MCSVSYVARQRSSGSDGQASAARLSVVGAGMVEAYHERVDGGEVLAVISNGRERGGEEEARLDGSDGRKPATARTLEPYGEPPPDHGPGEEGSERGQRPHQREARHARERESQKNHVAGHVRGKHSSEPEHAPRVEQSRGERPPQQAQRERRRLLVFHLLRSEEHTSELQSQSNLVCRLLLEKKKI